MRLIPVRSPDHDEQTGYAAKMLLLLLACHGKDTSESGRHDSAGGLDVAARLGEGQVRAGVVNDEAALFGGVSAEGRLGDVKIYNDRAQFVIQQPGDSNYYVEYGGNLVDADIVRAEGQPGRDVVDELAVMIGLGRVVDATSVTVEGDGSDGVAVVRVEGDTAPMHLITGALESDALVPDLDLHVITTYELRPGESSMTVRTTLQNRESTDQALAIGDVGLVSFDVGERWASGTGLGDAGTGAVRMNGIVGLHNEVTVGIVGDGADLEQGAIGQILGGIAASITGFSETASVPAGGEFTYTRRIGVARDPATLLGEAWARESGDKQQLSGVVRDTVGDAVPGARVHVVGADGAPLSLAFADASGSWSAVVPAGPVSLIVSGRGNGFVVDLPAGHAQISPYEVDQAASLAMLASGSDPIPFAEGYGYALGTPGVPPTLVAPAVLDITVADGKPAVVRVDRADADVEADDRFIPGRPGGSQVQGFVRDGQLDVPVEPGSYHVVVRRGVRDEVWTQDITVVSGERLTLAASVTPAYTVDGVWVGDPHSHAAPSADGGIPMEDRLLVQAANGVDIHFGTDHDHIADYRPLITPLGLDGVLRSVLADECSPVLRGHFNIWPVTQGLPGMNHGAPLWWFGYADTAEIFGWMRATAVPGGVVQANHPVGSSGMFSFADYDPAAGTVGAADKWSEDFDAMELLNSNDHEEYWDYYVDLTRRGKRVMPVGVSDSHSWTGGTPGLNVTFFDAETPFADYSDEALLAAVARRATVVSHGPYIDARVAGAWAPGAEVAPGTLDVTVYAPSWMPVETLTLWQDGEAVQTVPCAGAAPTPCTAAFALDPFSDAVYIVSAESVSSYMVEAWPGQLAWAATSGIYVDVDSDGWTAPYPWVAD